MLVQRRFPGRSCLPRAWQQCPSLALSHSPTVDVSTTAWCRIGFGPPDNSTCDTRPVARHLSQRVQEGLSKVDPEEHAPLQSRSPCAIVRHNPICLRSPVRGGFWDPKPDIRSIGVD